MENTTRIGAALLMSVAMALPGCYSKSREQEKTTTSPLCENVATDNSVIGSILRDVGRKCDPRWLSGIKEPYESSVESQRIDHYQGSEDGIILQQNDPRKDRPAIHFKVQTPFDDPNDSAGTIERCINKAILKATQDHKCNPHTETQTSVISYQE